MKKIAAAKVIDLEPTEYEADIPNKREPMLQPGAGLKIAHFAYAMVVSAFIGVALRYFGLR